MKNFMIAPRRNIEHGNIDDKKIIWANECILKGGKTFLIPIIYDTEKEALVANKRYSFYLKIIVRTGKFIEDVAIFLRLIYPSITHFNTQYIRTVKFIEDKKENP